uniref:Replication-associated protein n=1 Tax=Ciconia boyciana CRESS-DNA-virus sp. TaxID=2815024 RepID=A0A8A4XC47_9VIRU|nr:MAG: replication-associated protein [Ciconia boyciana CRESS-DNA-virus sp.]
MSGKRSASWVFTCFEKNWDWESVDLEKVKYGVWQLEKCPETGRKHWQGFVSFRGARTRGSVQKVLGIGKSYCSIANGTAVENRKYCTKKKCRVKGTEPVEVGDIESCGQGARTDLKEVCEVVKELGLDMAIKMYPEMYVKYGKGLEKLADHYEEGRRVKPKVTYIFGDSDSGKSHYACEKIAKGEYYSKDPKKCWWDGWKGEDIIVIDDMDGWIVDRNYTLRLLDKYQMMVEVKGGMKKFNAKQIVITSNRSPRYIGSSLGFGSKAFLRRLDKVIYMKERKVDRVWTNKKIEEGEHEVGGNIVAHFLDTGTTEDWEHNDADIDEEK